MEDQKLWVEPVGSIIVARLRGVCSEEILMECQERIVHLAKDTQHVKVLYDALEIDPPDIDLVLLQQKLETETKKKLGSAQLRIAILVPNTRIAYLARLSFGAIGEEQYRVFYNDLSQAVMWLENSFS